MDYLNGEESQPLYDWIEAYERFTEGQLRRIKKRAEQRKQKSTINQPLHSPSERGNPMVAAAPTEAIQTLEIRKEIFIEASPEIAFESLLEELGPGSQLPDGKPFPMKIEPWPGGRWYRDLGEAGGYQYGHLWGHVQVIKAPSLLELIGPMPMSFPAINHVQYRLKPEGKGVRLSLVHRAMGPLPQELRDGMPDGWEHGVKRIKEVAEQKAKGKA